MNRRMRVTILAAVTAAVTVSAAAAPAADPMEQNKSCVGYFVSTLAPQGVIDEIATTYAHNARPFGRNVISVQAHGDRDACPYEPADFAP